MTIEALRLIRQSLTEADKIHILGDNINAANRVLRAAALASRLRYSADSGLTDAEAFRKWIKDEWVVITQEHVDIAETRRFNRQLRTIDEILWLLISQPSDQSPLGESIETVVMYHIENDHDYWFETSPGTLQIHKNWLSGITRAIRFSPECRSAFPRDVGTPEDVVKWQMYRRSSTDGVRSHWRQREERIASLETGGPAATTVTPPAAAEPRNAVFVPSSRDELSYQVANLQFLCEAYWAGNHTLYKCATVILRTLVLGSSGDPPLVSTLNAPMLPRLARTMEEGDPGRFDMPSRVLLGQRLFFHPGSGVAGRVLIDGGAIASARVGALFGVEMIPLAEWLAQRFLLPNLTLGDFIKHVTNKDGGAHFEENSEAMRRLRECASLHWPLTIRIGEVIAEELKVQMRREWPEFEFRIP